MEIRKHIINNLIHVLKNLAGQEIKAEVKKTTDESNGDYYSNIALVHFKAAGFSDPTSFANALKERIEKLKDPKIEKIEIAGPGFINFFLSKDFLLSNLKEINDWKDKFGNSDKEKKKKIVIEYTDPNPFKEFHIGHLYSNAVGEALSRLFEAQGASVFRVNYQGDVGLHVAKAIYGLQFKMENLKLKMEDLEKKSLKEKIEFLGEAYAFGAKEYDEKETARKKIGNLNKKIYAKDKDILEFYEKGREWSLLHFEEIYKILGTKFDNYYFEGEVGEKGIEIVQKNISEVFEKSDRAIIFPGEKYGLHNRVFINSQGLPTYEAKELGLAFKKNEDFSHDKSVIITGNEINEYFKVVLEALGLIDKALREKTKHIAHGMVRLPSGKMSSRTGEIVKGEWLISQVKEKLSSKFENKNEETLNSIAIASIKYALLKNNIGADIKFDLEESISLNGNSGPYLQYSYVRIKSILNKSKISDVEQINSTKNLSDNEEKILRTLLHFSETVDEAAEKYAPNLLCNYLFELAKEFNAFYEKEKIAGNNLRIAIAQAISYVIQNGLNILGIKTVEKM